METNLFFDGTSTETLVCSLAAGFLTDQRYTCDKLYEVSPFFIP